MNTSHPNELNRSHISSHYIKNTMPYVNNINRSFRLEPSQLFHQIRSLQDQIQFTISNYQSILQTQKKNTNQRNEFLLYLIQTMKQKHNQQLQKYQSQLQFVIQQKQQANNLQSQMKNIGDGIDSILEEGKKLKNINQSLQKQLQQQNHREKQIDQEIYQYNKTIDQLRQQVDQWERKKLKWNRKKKDLIHIIQEAQNKIKLKICSESGVQQDNCDHCQNLKVKKLMLKYQNNGKSI